MQHVLVLDANKTPLMPCYPARARQLLREGKAAVYRRFPFAIILKERVGGDTQPIEVKIDPGSKTTGLALMAQGQNGQRVIWAAELTHRGQAIRDSLLSRRSLRRGRRTRHCRYRPARFNNRRKGDDWLPPSLRSRLFNTLTWVHRLCRFAPVTGIAQELVKFDTQLLDNPNISGVEYQQGELVGYEVREYLLEKWQRKCAYCGKMDIPLQIEHLIPKSRGGSNRISNLALACEKCNQKKGTRTATEFGFPDLTDKAKSPLKDAAAVNASRWALYRLLQNEKLPVSVGTGARTKYNRTQQNYPKAHWVDAACVGDAGFDVVIDLQHQPLLIKAMGHGTRQRCQTDKFGFPKCHKINQKRFYGFQTGDLAVAIVPKGKYAGRYVGRVTVRQKPSFTIGGIDVHACYFTLLQRGDGYSYNAP
jgi:5-methylcytosine-specific restriction endonuclease McrA